MTKEQLIEYKRKLAELNEQELKERDITYLRKLASGEIQGPQVGYASIDKPWLGYYPKEMFFERKKYNKIIDYIRDTWSNSLNDVMLHYYGKDITAREFFYTVGDTARCLKKIGLQKGDTIVTNLEGVPEFVYLFFAAEQIGVNIKNKIGADALEIAEVINESSAKCFFTHDYMSKTDANIIYENTLLENIIMVNPVEGLNGDFSSLRPHIKDFILSKYTQGVSDDNRNVRWSDFYEAGKRYNGDIYVESDEDTKLFSAYTSGSTGARKEVIHTSKTFLEMLDQMIFSISDSENRETWLWPSLPPSLVAIVLAYMCMPLAQGRKIYLDPYFDYKDIDLEMMYYEPNSTGLVSVFLESFIESKRIPENYDMSYLKILGFGAEAIPRARVLRIMEFLKKYNCSAPLNGGYGLSEGGSQVVIAFNNDILLMRSTGFPLINTTVAIFEPGTENELGYGQIGELCKAGPGIMLGYSTEEETNKVIKTHSDGRKWLHTGDFGYITENGFVFVLGREKIKIYNNQFVYPLELENKISDIEGVKNAIIVSGDSKIHEGYQAPYLFVVPMEGITCERLSYLVEEKLKDILKEEELPERVYSIDFKPVSHFKVDKKVLRRNYNITTNIK